MFGPVALALPIMAMQGIGKNIYKHMSRSPVWQRLRRVLSRTRPAFD